MAACIAIQNADYWLLDLNDEVIRKKLVTLALDYCEHRNLHVLSSDAYTAICRGIIDAQQAALFQRAGGGVEGAAHGPGASRGQCALVGSNRGPTPSTDEPRF